MYVCNYAPVTVNSIISIPCIQNVNGFGVLKLNHRPERHGESSGVARAFPGGRLAHPEGQNEEENRSRLRKNKKI